MRIEIIVYSRAKENGREDRRVIQDDTALRRGREGERERERETFKERKEKRGIGAREENEGHLECNVLLCLTVQTRQKLGLLYHDLFLRLSLP
jgi:hypothetical protein